MRSITELFSNLRYNYKYCKQNYVLLYKKKTNINNTFISMQQEKVKNYNAF